jgi:hypothetical protein
VQLPKRTAPDAFNDDYREWDEEKMPQENEEDNPHQVLKLVAVPLSVYMVTLLVQIIAALPCKLQIHVISWIR